MLPFQLCSLHFYNCIFIIPSVISFLTEQYIHFSVNYIKTVCCSARRGY